MEVINYGWQSSSEKREEETEEEKEKREKRFLIVFLLSPRLCGGFFLYYEIMLHSAFDFLEGNGWYGHYGGT